MTKIHKYVRQSFKLLIAQGQYIPLDSLFEALHDEDYHVRWAAVQAFADQRRHIPLDTLFKSLNHDTHNVREMTKSNLEDTGQAYSYRTSV